MRSTDFITLHAADVGYTIDLVPAHIMCIQGSEAWGSLVITDSGMRIPVCETPDEVKALIDAANNRAKRETGFLRRFFAAV
jgi:hypothetical protein